MVCAFEQLQFIRPVLIVDEIYEAQQHTGIFQVQELVSIPMS
jgi:hypothetical protein